MADYTNDPPIGQFGCRPICKHMDDELTCFGIHIHSYSARRNGYAVSQKHPRPVAFNWRPHDHKYRSHRGTRQQDRFCNGDIRLDDKTNESEEAVTQEKQFFCAKQAGQPRAEILPEPDSQDCQNSSDQKMLRVQFCRDRQPECH